MSILTTLQLIPLIGSLVLIALPKENGKLAKQIALGISLVVLGAAIYMWTQFDTSSQALQFVEVRKWIDFFGINYAVGVDGMALVLILMTVILVPIVIVAGWNESEGGRWSVKTF